MDIKIIKDVCVFNETRKGYLHFLTLEKDWGHGYDRVLICNEIFEIKIPYITYIKPQYPEPIVICIVTKDKIDLTNKMITFLKKEVINNG